MLAKLQMTLLPDQEEQLNYNASSLMHGWMMEQLEPDYASLLHQQTLRPFSQHVAQKDSVLTWEINTLNLTAYQKIIQPFLADNKTSVYLKHKNLNLIIVQKDLKQKISYDSFISKHYLNEQAPKSIKLWIKTPAAFKSGGRYNFWPDIRMLLQSAMLKYDASTPSHTIYNETVLEDLCEHCYISSYRIKSVRFHLESIQIPAFIGEITIKTNGNNTIRSLAQMLLSYTAFCGIGIKTALGMGTVQIIERTIEKNAPHQTTSA